MLNKFIIALKIIVMLVITLFGVGALFFSVIDAYYGNVQNAALMFLIGLFTISFVVSVAIYD